MYQLRWLKKGVLNGAKQVFLRLKQEKKDILGFSMKKAQQLTYQQIAS